MMEALAEERAETSVVAMMVASEEERVEISVVVIMITASVAALVAIFKGAETSAALPE
jgi:hypothetical protein